MGVAGVCTRVSSRRMVALGPRAALASAADSICSTRATCAGPKCIRCCLSVEKHVPVGHKFGMLVMHLQEADMHGHRQLRMLAHNFGCGNARGDDRLKIAIKLQAPEAATLNGIDDPKRNETTVEGSKHPSKLGTTPQMVTYLVPGSHKARDGLVDAGLGAADLPAVADACDRHLPTQGICANLGVILQTRSWISSSCAPSCAPHKPSGARSRRVLQGRRHGGLRSNVLGRTGAHAQPACHCLFANPVRGMWYLVQLVELADLEEDDGVAVLAFDLPVLLLRLCSTHERPQPHLACCGLICILKGNCSRAVVRIAPESLLTTP